MPKGIIICGANGSGKTTLGKKLAKALNYRHIDVEDYYFPEQDIPYTKSRTHDEVRQLILQDIRKYNNFIISSVTGDMGYEINAMYGCAVYLSAPSELRLERVKQRSYDKFRERILPGGDMYEKEQRFFDFVALRSMEKTEQWLKALSCPVIYVDGTKGIADNVKWLTSEYLNIIDGSKE